MTAENEELLARKLALEERRFSGAIYEIRVLMLHSAAQAGANLEKQARKRENAVFRE
jgi:hypothetical protein